MVTSRTDSAPEIAVRRLPPSSALPSGLRQEMNQLWYDQHTVLAADYAGEMVGAIRIATRVDAKRRHGLIADLQLAPGLKDTGLEERLIEAAEAELKERGVTKIDAIIPDGEGRSSYFYRLGFWPSRKTVAMAWNLATLTPALEVEGVRVWRMDPVEVAAVTDLVLASYQPYWVWWKEQKEDKRWFRVDFPAEQEPPDSEELAAEMRERVRGVVEEIAASPECTAVFVAEVNGELMGLCDARLPQDARDDTFSFGVLVRREAGGKRIGSALLGQALHWLKARGVAQARVLTTSGLDDFDPTVYLYTLAHSGQILGEFINLVKRR